MAKTKKTKTITVITPRHGLNPVKIGAYQSLLEEIDAIRTETVYNASQVILEGKLEVGQLLLKNNDLGVGVTELVQYVSKDTGINERDLWYCYKFAEKYEEIKKLPDFDTKVISWNRVKKMLADPERAKKKCKHDHTEWIEICVDCGAKIKHEDED